MLTFAQKTSDATQRLIERLQHEVLESQPKTVVFIAARSKEGTSTIASEYAAGLAHEGQRKVLMVEATAHNDNFTLHEAVEGKCAVAQAIIPHEQGILSCALGGNESATTLVKTFEAVQDELLTHADVVVIDAPSLEQNGLGVLLAAKAQAVVLVVAAETTPQPVVEHLQQRLQSAGANIAGVVLNKRRYIPHKIYKRL